MIDKLKPCPFCGGKAKIMQLVDFQPVSILNDRWIIGCDGIHASLCPGNVYKCAPFYMSKELAVRMWNNRDGKKEESI